MKHIFENIIINNYWYTSGEETPCGAGSTLEYTVGLRKNLLPFLKKYQITSMLDAPCGDYHWMKLVQFSKDFQYIGADVVDSLIEKNKSTYPNVDFRVLDISTDQLPAVDLLFCRDCLFHFSVDDVIRTLNNFVKSDIKYLLTSNYPGDNNSSINTGEFHPINLTKDPYNLPSPIDYIEDWIEGYPIRHMSLWNLSTIKLAIQ